MADLGTLREHPARVAWGRQGRRPPLLAVTVCPVHPDRFTRGHRGQVSGGGARRGPPAHTSEKASGRHSLSLRTGQRAPRSQEEAPGIGGVVSTPVYPLKLSLPEPPALAVFGDRAFRKVIPVKWGHMAGPKPHDQCPWKTGGWDPDTHAQRGDPVRTRRQTPAVCQPRTGASGAPGLPASLRGPLASRAVQTHISGAEATQPVAFAMAAPAHGYSVTCPGGGRG